MYEVTMPKLSDSMEIGRVVEWRTKEGDEVKEGQTIADVESDKATMELEAFNSGTLVKIVHGDGDEVPIGEVIAFIGDASEAIPDVAVSKPAPAEKKPAPAASPAPKPEPVRPVAPRPVATGGVGGSASPYARKLAAELGVDIAKLAGSGPGGRIVAADVKAAPASAKADGEPAPPKQAAPASAVPNVDADPMAASVAKKYDIDLEDVQGTGTGGRITVQDVMSARPPECCVAAPPSPDEELPELDVKPDEADVVEAPFRLRTQARIVTASKHAIPHFYMTRGADVTELLEKRSELKSKYSASITHAVMWSVLQSIKKHPKINRSYDRGKVINWKHVNLGLAVATEKGLTVAVLREAEDLTIKDLAEKVGPLVERARGGKLTPEERNHATFTITNLGMFDVEEFMPVINPPSAVTLGVAAALETAVVRDGQVQPGRVMKLTMACDHRVLEGAPAAEFLHDLRKALERPGTMLD